MAAEILPRVDDCPDGGVFYVCNGFRGCCSMDPCMPGSTCSVDKDLTPASDGTTSIPNGPSSTPTPTTTASPSSSSSMITTTSAASSTTPAPSPSLEFALSLAEPSYKTVTEHALRTTAPASTGPARENSAHSVPVAAIVGAVLGGVILCTLLIILFFWIRKRRLTKVYKAPAYPSPLVGSDMTPQLSSKSSSQFQQKVAALYRADSIERCEPPQLDSLEIPYQRGRRGSIGQFAELPAEPLPWPGHSPDR